LLAFAEDGGHFGSKTNPIAYKITGKTWVNNHAHVLRPLPECDVDYLTHVLSFYDVSKIISGTTRPKLTKGNAESIRIPLPPLCDQQKIAARLEKTNRLRRMRRYALQMCDELLPAAFLQMFGEADATWPIITIEELAQAKPHAIRTGPFGSQLLHSEFAKSGIAVLGIDNAVNNRFEWV
jgi:type I restriction enzyme S subunit